VQDYQARTRPGPIGGTDSACVIESGPNGGTDSACMIESTRGCQVTGIRTGFAGTGTKYRPQEVYRSQDCRRSVGHRRRRRRTVRTGLTHAQWSHLRSRRRDSSVLRTCDIQATLGSLLSISHSCSRPYISPPEIGNARGLPPVRLHLCYLHHHSYRYIQHAPLEQSRGDAQVEKRPVLDRCLASNRRKFTLLSFYAVM
jgi:hypothetical protein